MRPRLPLRKRLWRLQHPLLLKPRQLRLMVQHRLLQLPHLGPLEKLPLLPMLPQQQLALLHLDQLA